MKIAILNKKGGTGKTPIAMSLAIDLQLNIATNDTSVLGFFSAQQDSYFYGRTSFIHDEDLINFKMSENQIFDFGGWTPRGAINVISQCDKVIIPCSAENPNATIQTASTITELTQSIDKVIDKIVVIITMYEKDDEFSERKAEIEQYFSVPILPLKKTKLFNNVIGRGISPKEAFNESLANQHFYRNIYPQYAELLDFVSSK